MKFAIAGLAALALSGTALARAHYGGGHHTTSHGGHYTGGHGSSHSGGHFTSLSGSHSYGTHK
jgi:hypothetical protein